MALFKKKKQDENIKDVSQEKEENSKHSSQKKSSGVVRNVLIKPLITEKASDLMSLNKYIFLVDKKANKNLVKQNVMARYNVKVEKVDIVNIKGKVKYFRNMPYKKQDIKKAIVTLKKGEKIDIQ